jgi:recombination protein U
MDVMDADCQLYVKLKKKGIVIRVINNGKRLESNFKKSVPSNIFYYRFKDGSSAWGGNDKVRFQTSNICDCMLYNGLKLYLIELKSVKGKSLPFTNIRTNQIEELSKAHEFYNIHAGLVIEFSDLNRAFFIDVKTVEEFIAKGDRKSLPIDYVATNGIEIDVVTKKVNNVFNIEKMIEEI